MLVKAIIEGAKFSRDFLSKKITLPNRDNVLCDVLSDKHIAVVARKKR